MACAFNEEKVANKFKNIPVSKQTVTRMVKEIVSHISNKLQDVIHIYIFHWP